MALSNKNSTNFDISIWIPRFLADSNKISISFFSILSTKAIQNLKSLF